MRVVPGRRGLAGKIGAPLISQGLTAGSSLVLQVIAARTLGLAGFGVFALCLAVLVTASALYTGYIGDSIAVLDRQDRDTRAALAGSALIAWVLCFVAGAGTILVLRQGSLTTASVYGAMLVLWLAEDTLRRLLMARLAFWRLVINDLGYFVVTMVVLFAGYLIAGSVTLTGIFTAMAVGAAAAVGIGVLQVPRAELTRLRPGVAGMKAVFSFAAWRSLQATLRPAALLGARVLVTNVLSLAAVGALEAGRLVVAPLQVIINGAGSFLLSGFASSERDGAGTSGALTRRAVLLLVVTTAVGGGGLALGAGVLGELMTGAPVRSALVLGWAAYLVVWAAGLPYVTEVVARRRSRAVFLVRLVDSLLGLGLVAIALAFDAGIVFVPWLLAVGGLYSVWRLRRLAIRTRSA